MEREKNFFLEGQRGEGGTKIVRTDLDGAPRPGKGTWRLLRLVPPEKPLLPADLPSKKSERAAAPGEKAPAGDVTTPGDLLRPRWSADYSVEQWLHTWKDGAEQGSGALVHDAKGEARVELPALASGAYRLRYATVDDFGAPYETAQDFLVAGGKTAPALPAVLLAESSSVPVGGVARFLVASGLREQTMFLDVARAGRPIERRILKAGTDPVVIERTITEDDRGGLGVTLTAVRDHQFLQQTGSVFVPWDDKELKVEFATFRDNLRPGQTETWRVTVKGATPEHPLKETAELLAYMYDRSLDVFAPHHPPSPLSLLPNRASRSWRAPRSARRRSSGSRGVASRPSAGAGSPRRPAEVRERYGIGGPGRRGGIAGGIAYDQAYPASAPAEARAMKSAVARQQGALNSAEEGQLPIRRTNGTRRSIHFPRRKMAIGCERTKQAKGRRRSAQQLLRDGLLEAAAPDGAGRLGGHRVHRARLRDLVEVSGSHAVTRDLQGGSRHEETRSVKDLMVRPYLPRFLREGDRAEHQGRREQRVGSRPLSGDAHLRHHSTRTPREPPAARSASRRTPRRARSP